MPVEGFWADIQVNGQHLWLFSERNALEAQGSVYDVTAKQWIVPSEPVDDIEAGKERAIEYARIYLKHSANLELPPLVWKDARSL
jgi:hypothetical protein